MFYYERRIFARDMNCHLIPAKPASSSPRTRLSKTWAHSSATVPRRHLKYASASHLIAFAPYPLPISERLPRGAGTTGYPFTCMSRNRWQKTLHVNANMARRRYNFSAEKTSRPRLHRGSRDPYQCGGDCNACRGQRNDMFLPHNRTQSGRRHPRCRPRHGGRHQRGIWVRQPGSDRSPRRRPRARLSPSP